MLRTVIAVGFAAAMFSAPAAFADPWVATSTGVGPLKVGMTVTQASEAAGVAISLDDNDSEDVKQCASVVVPGHPGLFVLFLNERIDSFLITPKSAIQTARGIGVGATEAAVGKAYAPLETEPADFDEEPAANLTWWAKKGAYGIRFRTDRQRIVRYISFGGSSLRYTEGCL